MLKGRSTLNGFFARLLQRDTSRHTNPFLLSETLRSEPEGILSGPLARHLAYVVAPAKTKTRRGLTSILRRPCLNHASMGGISLDLYRTRGISYGHPRRQHASCGLLQTACGCKVRAHTLPEGVSGGSAMSKNSMNSAALPIVDDKHVRE